MNNPKIKKPFFAMAPMANITTYPFAQQCLDFGADFVWTPMVHTDTIINNWPEAEKILKFPGVKKYIVQIIGSEPQKFHEAVKIIDKNISPFGIDLNFACPDKNIVKSGCGGSLMRDTGRIKDIINTVTKATKLPVSIKTRAGWDNYTDVFELVRTLESCSLWLITVHPRTVKQGFTGEANWEVIADLVKNFPKESFCGSGDIKTWRQAIETQEKIGCDGIMVGRAALGRPWIFKEIKSKEDYNTSLEEIKKLVLNLAREYDRIWGDKGILEARKHFAWYFKDFPGASEWRRRLTLCKSLEEVEKNIYQKTP